MHRSQGQAPTHERTRPGGRDPWSADLDPNQRRPPQTCDDHWFAFVKSQRPLVAEVLPIGTRRARASRAGLARAEAAFGVGEGARQSVRGRTLSLPASYDAREGDRVGRGPGGHRPHLPAPEEGGARVALRPAGGAVEGLSGTTRYRDAHPRRSRDCGGWGRSVRRRMGGGGGRGGAPRPDGCRNGRLNGADPGRRAGPRAARAPLPPRARRQVRGMRSSDRKGARRGRSESRSFQLEWIVYLSKLTAIEYMAKVLPIAYF